MALNLLLLAAASTATATSLHSGPLPLRRRTNQPKDQSSLAIKAIRLRGGSSTGGADWRFFVAGSISAALSHGYTTPIDVIKTRMQTNPELYNGSAILALRTIVESDGTPPPPPLERAHTRTHSHSQPPSLAHALAHPPRPRQALSSYCRASCPRSLATAPRARSSSDRTRCSSRSSRSSRAAPSSTASSPRASREPSPPSCSAQPRRSASAWWRTRTTRPTPRQRSAASAERRAPSAR